MCREEACVRSALKTGQIPRALKGRLEAPDLAQMLEWMGLTGTLRAD